MKTKLKFYNRVYKEIKKGFLRIYFFLEIKLLRFLHFTSKDKVFKKKTKYPYYVLLKTVQKNSTDFLKVY